MYTREEVLKLTESAFAEGIKAGDMNSLPTPRVRYNEWVKENITRKQISIESLCLHAFIRRDLNTGLPFNYTDTNFQGWKKSNLEGLVGDAGTPKDTI